MKQILKYGKFNVAICTSCSCEFSFEKVDVLENGKVTCPCCNAEVTAPVNK